MSTPQQQLPPLGLNSSTSNANQAALAAAGGGGGGEGERRSSSSQFDREALRRFYMSPGRSFTAFQRSSSSSSSANNSARGDNNNQHHEEGDESVGRRLPQQVETPGLFSSGGGGGRNTRGPGRTGGGGGGVGRNAVTPSPTSAESSPTAAGMMMNLSNIAPSSGANTPPIGGVGLGGVRNMSSSSSSQQNNNNNNNSSGIPSGFPASLVSSAATAVAGGGGNRRNSSNKNNNNNNNNQQQQQQQQQNQPAASPEYLAFLRQQQDLLNIRGKVERVLNELRQVTREQEKYLSEQRGEGEKMLHQIEEGSSWNLRSKYDVKQLQKDCGLTLLQQELLKDQPADIANLQALFERLSQLVSEDETGKAQEGRGNFASSKSKDVSASASPIHLFVENAARRIGVILDNLRSGNANTTHVARAAEPVVMLLHTLCTQPTVEAVVTPYARSIEQCVFELEKARKEREMAYQDGEIQSAEGLSYDIVEAHEAMLDQLMVKLDALEKCTDEVRAMTLNRETVSKTTENEMENLFNSTEKMRKRCEDDVKKTFALREKVEEVEIQTTKRMQEEHVRSDDFLDENQRKLNDAFGRLQETFDEIENLERERHREIQKRLTEKDKDEHRRAEYAQFTQTADEHVVPLERTLKNMVLIKSATDALRQLARGSFSQIDESLRQRESILNLATTEAHKQHVEAFRGYLIELGDVVSKKERMIEEVDDNIQQAIAQKEILTETFNPAAKKFGDIKRKLLASRDELEQDVVGLKQRAADALKRFHRTEEVLNRAGIAFVHPVVEQEHHAMEVQAKLMQYKALAIGHVEGHRLMDDITEFRSRLDDTKKEVTVANATVSGTIGRTIPLVRAAQQQQAQRMALTAAASSNNNNNSSAALGGSSTPSNNNR